MYVCVWEILCMVFKIIMLLNYIHKVDFINKTMLNQLTNSENANIHHVIG